MAVAIQVEITGLERAQAVLSHLGGDTEQLMTNIGGALADSTRKRIDETKTSPDGAAWAPNKTGNSILLATGGHLLARIAFIASAEDVEVGASWEYAHVHQFGATITPKSAKALVFTLGGQTVRAKSVTIPARPFVGLSAEDATEVERLTTDWLGLAAGGR